MNRKLSAAFTLLVATPLLACPLVASPAPMKRIDFVVDGKVTEHAGIVGRTTATGDEQHDHAFVLNGLYKFVYAGAGFTSPNARIHARLAVNKFEGTGAGMLVNGHWFGFDAKPENRIFGAGEAFDGKTTTFAKAADHIAPGEPFDMVIEVKDGTLTYSLNGKQVASVSNFPRACDAHPVDAGKGHKLQLVTAIRSWRAKVELYSFYVETEGELVALPKSKAVFRSMGSRGTHTFRIPALLVTKKNTLLAFAEARRNGAHDSAEIDTVVRRSEDDGKSWGPEIVVFDGGGNVAGNPCPVVDQSTGRIWSLNTWNSSKVPENRIKSGFGEDSRRVFVTYSDDDGKTWAEPNEITTSVKRRDWSWYATGPGAGIQLERGKYKGRLIIPCDHKSLPTGKPHTYHSHIVYSDDHGKSWQIGAVSEMGLNECEAVELEDGSVMLNSRNHGVDSFHRGVSISKDGGETFTSFRRDPKLLEPRCQASIHRYRWAVKNKPGIILFANPAQKWREYLMLRMSYDDGKTWPDARIIYPYTSAYCDLAILSDGRIAVLYERDNATRIDLAILPALK
ncbi:MAG: exo-alpha-sialidase [Roseibacillus sp.]